MTENQSNNLLPMAVNPEKWEKVENLLANKKKVAPSGYKNQVGKFLSFPKKLKLFIHEHRNEQFDKFHYLSLPEWIIYNAVIVETHNPKDSIPQNDRMTLTPVVQLILACSHNTRTSYLDR
jgi:hypothetical protein